MASTAVSLVRRPRYVGKRELFSIPGFSWLLKQIGVIPLDRGQGGGDILAIRSAMQVITEGGCLILFPEGTRSKTGKPGRPKQGVSFLAHQTGAQVLPARIWNTREILKFKPLRIKFGVPRSFDVSLLEGRSPKEAYQMFAERVMEDVFSIQ